ncbi:MAG TPA: HAMP domain-containing sensor histidine kinase [Ktedonosporobacter sp.]|jgi:signal transduction histidine kinase|nr:HAMP domain-containing sensor histidine kinase [Ktedonosporobacter sp.]
MSTEMSLRNLANDARHLLDCGGAYLFLGCPEPTLRHPLLNLFYRQRRRTPHCYGSLAGPAPLYDERVCALYDMAVQTGLMWCIDRIMLPGMKNCGSMAAVPLERPQGILGLLLLVDPRPESFLQGECSLMEQYLPVMAQRVEEALSETCLSPDPEQCQDTMTDTQMQSELISLVSHELRAPLTAIKGYAGLLQAYSVSDSRDDGCVAMPMTAERQQQYLDVIMEQANHLEVLISDLHDMSRIQSGRLALRCAWVDLVQQCERAVQLMRYRISQQPVRHYIRYSAAPDLPLVWADPDRVQQVLTNLIENAVKYSPDGGLIDIMAYTRRTIFPVTLCPLSERASAAATRRSSKTFVARGSLMAYVTVRDQGIGIPRLQQPHLFQPFTRLEHPATTNVTGAGLGLYISRKLVEAMQGNMMLKSNEGKGTSVTFTLPTEPLNKTFPLDA